MQYRSLPKAPGLALSILGVDCARLPTGGDGAAIDEGAATQLVHAAIESGINYVQTASTYHRGASGPFLARALKGGWREKVLLASKLPVSLVREADGWERFLDGELGRLDTDRIDLCLLDALEGGRWAEVNRSAGLRALERARASRRIGCLGFSFHGPFTEFKEVVDGHDWDFCQIELSFLDGTRDVGLEEMSYAAAKDVGVVAAEALRGGALASAPPWMEDLWSSSGRTWPPAEWALRWIWNHPAVVTATTAMNAAGELRACVGAAAVAEPLTREDLERIERVRRTYRSMKRVPCTTCGSCRLACPSGVAIPNALSLYNDAMFDSKAEAAEEYRRAILGAGEGADRCVACGQCESICPEGIAIRERLRQAHAYLTGA